MKTIDVDVAIIGAGTAGLNARREVEKAGKRPVMIESGPYGTTCARVGCMPSKLLIAASDRAHDVETAEPFGIDVEHWSIDDAVVMDRVRSERDRFVSFVVEDTEEIPEEQRLRGAARFVAPGVLQVDDHTRVKADAVVIATGSHPVVPPIYDGVSEHVLLNDDVFELKKIPESLAVIGMGIIGLELGQALQRLGARTLFFNPFDTVGSFTDPALQKATRKILGEELNLKTGITMDEAQVVEGAVKIGWTSADGSREEAIFEKILVAAGRKPNLACLNPEEAGLKLDEEGLKAWDATTTQVGDLPVFIAGDASGHRPLLHEASDEGRIAGSNAARFPDVLVHVRRTPIAVAFTDPNMALIGKTWSDLDEERIAVGEVSFDNQGRSRVMGINRGLLRIYGERKTCKILGAEMLGPRAEHLAHLLAWSVQAELTVQQALQMPFYHPVIEEGLRTALRDLAKNLRITGSCRGEDLAISAGM